MLFATRLIRLILFGILLALLIALAWTTLQIATIKDDSAAPVATAEARRAAYRATATAIRADDNVSSLDYNPGYVLMQDHSLDAAPESAAGDEADAADPTAVPDDFDLPKLLIPRSPKEGKWLSGMLAPRRVKPVISAASAGQYYALGQR